MSESSLEKRIEKIEDKQNELEAFVNKSIKNIQIGITEIKTILQEQEKQETYKDTTTKEDIKEINKKLDQITSEIPKITDHEKRLTRIESNQQWLWRSIAGTVITLIGGLIVSAIKVFG